MLMARAWIAFDLSDSGLSIGAVTFAAMVPRVFVTPFSGYLSDRFDRRSLRWDREWCRTVIRGYCRRWFWLRLIYRGSRKAVPGDGEQCRQDERFFG